jgi:3-dehydroquinate dehydratase / shikimate dehydrogenase
VNRARNKGKICVSIAAETADQMIEKIGRAERFADVIEVRFDSLLPQELEWLRRARTYPGPANEVVESTKSPIISTFRPKGQGGFREISIAEREAFWTSGHETAYCDVEEDVVGMTEAPWLWDERICSYHDFSGVPKDMEGFFDRLAQTDTGIIKIAVHAEDSVEAIPVWRLIEYAKSYKAVSRPKVIPIAMGQAGKWTRILGLAHGAYLTYASLDEGQKTAEGQISVNDMIETYRVKQLDRDTKVYGVIGDPVSGSLSPYLHNAAFKETGTDAVFVPLQVKDVDAFFTRMVLPATREVELNFAGFAVTMPHKQAVMKYLDDIDPAARDIGAVNTVRIEGKRMIGYNTDTHGFMTVLKGKFGDIAGVAVAILGAGGAARACAYGLKDEGAKLTIFGRDKEKVESLASEFETDTGAISNLKFQISDFDVLINATPIGMKGEREAVAPLTAEQLKGVRLVFDLVTSANDTPLVSEAKRAGITAVSGIEMLIEQGAKQFEIWTGRAAPMDIMRNAAQAKMESTK